MKTLSQVVNILVKRGYSKDFQVKEDTLVATDGFCLECQAFNIDKTYRFEGMSDPGDNAIVYAISSIDGEPLGLFIDAYGVYAQDISDRLKFKFTEADKMANRGFEDEEEL